MADENQAALDKSRERGLKLLDDHDGWKVAKSKDDITIETKPSELIHGNIHRLTVYLPISLENAIATYPVLYNSKRLEWDKDTNKIKLLKELSETQCIQIVHLNAIAKGIISAREFVIISDAEKKEDEYVLYGTTLDMQYLPVAQDHVRGEAGSFYLKLDKDPARPGLLRLVYIADFDFKGSVPKSLSDSSQPPVIFESIQKWKKYLQQNNMLTA